MFPTQRVGRIDGVASSVIEADYLLRAVLGPREMTGDGCVGG